MTSRRLPPWCYLVLLGGSMLCRAAGWEPAPSGSGQPARAEAWTALVPNLGDTYAMDLPFAWHTAAVRSSGMALIEHGVSPFDWLPEAHP